MTSQGATGTIVASWRLFFGPLYAFHHDILVLPNGHWLILADVYKEFTDLAGYPGTTNVLGDVLLDVDLSGKVVWAW